MAMTIDKLQEIAEEFLETNFGIELEVPLSTSNSLDNVFGCLGYEVLKPDNGETLYWAHDIRISEDLANSDNDEYTKDTLKHELIHYALMVAELPCEDDAPEFIAACKRLNVGLTRTKKSGYKYKCSSCNREFIQEAKGECQDFTCNAPAEYVGMVIW